MLILRIHDRTKFIQHPLSSRSMIWHTIIGSKRILCWCNTHLLFSKISALYQKSIKKICTTPSTGSERMMRWNDMAILHKIIGYKTYMSGWIRRTAQYQWLPKCGLPNWCGKQNMDRNWCWCVSKFYGHIKCEFRT